MYKFLFALSAIICLCGCVQNPSNINGKTSVDSNSKKAAAAPNYCECQKINRDDGTKVTQFISLPVASDNKLEFGMAISSNGENIFIAVTLRFNGTASKIMDNLSIRLDDNNLITVQLVNQNLAYIGNSQVANGIFVLDESAIQKLKSSNLQTVSVKLADTFIHTLTCNKNVSLLKEQLTCFSKNQ